jgi:hypothetical protein
MNDNRIPKVKNIWLKHPSYPVISMGDISFIYNGTITELIPVTIPTINRPSMNVFVTANYYIKYPIIPKISAKKKHFLRVNFFKSGPIMNDPIPPPIVIIAYELLLIFN